METSVLKSFQFVAPLIGVFLYIAAFASENWVVADGSRKWGILTKCGPGGVNTTEVICKYMTTTENSGYYEAARFLSSFAVVLYIGLVFNFKAVELKLCKHQLIAIVAYTLTALIASVLLLISEGYKDDHRWKDDNPSLGWSYWAATASAVCSCVSAIAFTIRGRQEYLDSEQDTRKRTGTAKVHPTLQGNGEFDHVQKGKLPTAEGSGTESADAESDGTHQQNKQSESPHQNGEDREQRAKRPWKRRLSPINEKGNLGILRVETAEVKVVNEEGSSTDGRNEVNDREGTITEGLELKVQSKEGASEESDIQSDMRVANDTN